MQRRHFELIAEMFKAVKDSAPSDSVLAEAVDAVALRFAMRLTGTNIHFKASRFLDACGWEARD